MKITISEACANELRLALAVQSQGETPPVALPPPAQPPITAPVDGTVAGYDKVLRFEWDWSAPPAPIYTYKAGGIGPHGIVVIGFNVLNSATDGSMGSISIAPYPGDISSCERRISIGREGDFTQPYPWTRTGSDTGMQFVIGPSNRFASGLKQGGRYFINIESPGCANAGRACDMVIQCSRPT